MSHDDVSVVMISMNEEGSIAKVVRDIHRDLPGAEVLIVDSSSDRTPEIAADEGARVVRQVPPRGYGPAMHRALTEPDRDIVVTLDCDDTYPTERLADIVGMVRRGSVDIAGTTRLRGKPAAMPWSNYMANVLFNLVASIVFLRPIRDVHTGMRAYRREVLQNVTWHPEGAALPVELLLAPIRLGYRVGEVPIAYRERIGASTLHRLDSTKWTLRRIFRCRFWDVAKFRADG